MVFGRLVIHTQNCTTFVDEVVVAHVKGCEGITGHICNPVTKIVITSGDKAALFKI